MANGIMGEYDLAANTDTVVATISTTGDTAVFNVAFCNRTATDKLVRLCVSDTTSVSASGYLLYDFTIKPNGVLERTGLMAQNGKKIIARSNASGVNVVVYGYGG